MVKNASSSPFNLQLSNNQRDTSLVFKPQEEKKITYFNHSEVKSSSINKFSNIGFRKKKIIEFKR